MWKTSAAEFNAVAYRAFDNFLSQTREQLYELWTKFCIEAYSNKSSQGEPHTFVNKKGPP